MRRDDDVGTERRENSVTELPVFSPVNLTGADLLSFNLLQRRGLSSPTNLQSLESPAEDLSEILGPEIANSPLESVNNRTSRVLRFSKENWNLTLSKSNSKKSQE